MSIEAGVVLDLKGEPLHWHLPPGRSVGGLPDSRRLWDVIWENRDNISGIAHSHPGKGKPGPSYEDVTTFSAIEAALGRRLDWWIVSAGDCNTTLLRWVGPGKYTYQEPGDVLIRMGPGKWIGKLVELSNENERKEDRHDDSRL